jgi:putative hydrolase
MRRRTVNNGSAAVGAAASTHGFTHGPDCAAWLREAADLLQAQGANPTRVDAYRNAAGTLAGLDRSAVIELVESEGTDGVARLPRVSRGIATAVVEMVRTGHWTQLERLRGTSDPVQLFTVVPGLGHRLAERIHEELHIDTLDALAVAAQDGLLEHVPGVGRRRAETIRASLHALLLDREPAGGSSKATVPSSPPVPLLLAIDRQYREQSAAGALPTIAPTRFNPSQTAWMPVMHAERDGWQFTALYSNTAQAHQMKRTHDWVLVYHYDAESSEGHHTVITETHGGLAGKRVVRGRETECRTHYAS